MPTIARTLASIGEFSKRDAERWPEFVAFMDASRGVPRRRLSHADAAPAERRSLAEGLPLAKLALKLRRLGAQATCSASSARMPMSALELTEEWFESDAAARRDRRRRHPWRRRSGRCRRAPATR